MIQWLEAGEVEPPPSLADAVLSGLAQRPKTFPSHFFYDAKGSKLFEMICDLPEYYLTRAETEILKQSANRIADRLPQIETLVELGSGSAVKTELLLQSFLRRGALRYVPIDVSRSALEESVDRIHQLHPTMSILPAVAEYEGGLAAIQPLDLGPRLFLWLGSSIGNLRKKPAAAFLRRCREKMNPGDFMLIGIDLRKDPETLEQAYNDAQGVTAEFNMNLLDRMNRELDADFDPSTFRHRVHYDTESGSVQSYLESQSAQTVSIRSMNLEIEFDAGERIHTEDSFKYSLEEIDALGQEAGLEIVERYFDREGEEKRFSLSLFGVA